MRVSTASSLLDAESANTLALAFFNAVNLNDSNYTHTYTQGVRGEKWSESAPNPWPLMPSHTTVRTIPSPPLPLLPITISSCHVSESCHTMRSRVSRMALAARALIRCALSNTSTLPLDTRIPCAYTPAACNPSSSATPTLLALYKCCKIAARKGAI
jgi:hypothetical protein